MESFEILQLVNQEDGSMDINLAVNSNELLKEGENLKFINKHTGHDLFVYVLIFFERWVNGMGVNGLSLAGFCFR